MACSLCHNKVVAKTLPSLLASVSLGSSLSPDCPLPAGLSPAVPDVAPRVQGESQVTWCCQLPESHWLKVGKGGRGASWGEQDVVCVQQQLSCL